MGIYTGSDCDVKRALNKQLKEMGMKGEGIMDRSVSIVKTHWPEREGEVGKIKVSKVILITRNPLDAIPSLFNMIATGSHSNSMPQNIEQKTCELWEKFVV